MDSRPIRKEDELPEPCLHPSDDGKYDILYIYIQLSPHSTTPTPSPTPTRPSARHAYTSLCPTHAIFWSYSSGKLNDTPAFWRRSSRGCRCRCLRRGMRALGDFMEPLYSWRKKYRTTLASSCSDFLYAVVRPVLYHGVRREDSYLSAATSTARRHILSHWVAR